MKRNRTNFRRLISQTIHNINVPGVWAVFDLQKKTVLLTFDNPQRAPRA